MVQRRYLKQDLWGGGRDWGQMADGPVVGAGGGGGGGWDGDGDGMIIGG